MMMMVKTMTTTMMMMVMMMVVVMMMIMTTTTNMEMTVAKTKTVMQKLKLNKAAQRTLVWQVDKLFVTEEFL